MRALSAANTVSQATTISMPPASASPCTAATTGRGEASKRRVTSWMAPMKGVSASADLRRSSTSSRSAPVQNCLPFAFSSTARTAGSASNRSMPSLSPSSNSVEMQLNLSGRLRVSTPTPPSTETSTASVIALSRLQRSHTP